MYNIHTRASHAFKHGEIGLTFYPTNGSFLHAIHLEGPKTDIHLHVGVDKFFYRIHNYKCKTLYLGYGLDEEDFNNTNMNLKIKNIF